MSSPYPWGRRPHPAARRLAMGATLVVLFLLPKRLFQRIEVEGPSMLPALAPGDRLVVLRTPVLEEGDLIALVDPEDEERLLVKRVTSLGAFELEVRGDNPGASRDSRQFGPVRRGQVLGRVIYRYHPAAAAGRIARAKAR